MRTRFDLSGFWHGRLELDSPLNVAAPTQVRRHFFVPLPWNKQIEDLRWAHENQELSGVVRSVQGQNFRDVNRKFNEGRITYRRMVSIPRPLVESAGGGGSVGGANPSSRRAFLVFEGSNYRTTAVINGRKIGTHQGGHLRFEFEVTLTLQPGVNKFQIVVDNYRKRDQIPQEQFNWQNFGGIHRQVYLEWRPTVHLAKWSVTPGRDSEGWFVDVGADLSEPTNARVWAEATSGKETNRVQLTGLSELRRGRVRFKDPTVWKPGIGGVSHFHLMLEEEKEVIDEVVGSFGLRTVELKGGQVVVNGEPVRLAGAAMHEQHPAFGSSVPGWQVTRDIKLLKHAGFNAIRAAHYPFSQEFYDACDREGMLVLAELPCWQFDSFQFTEPKVQEMSVQMARAMVAQLGHHPSIIGWIVQNESRTFDRGANEFFAAIHSAIKQADPMRFTLSAENPFPPQHLMAAARAAGSPAGPLPPTSQVVDAVGINCASGWTADKADQLPALLDHFQPMLDGKAIFVTEIGAEAIPGARSLELQPWSEDFQAELLCRHIGAIVDRPWVAGFFIWAFADFEASSVAVQGRIARGIVDEHRRPKAAFYQVRSMLHRLSPDQTMNPPMEVNEPDDARDAGETI